MTGKGPSLHHMGNKKETPTKTKANDRVQLSIYATCAFNNSQKVSSLPKYQDGVTSAHQSSSLCMHLLEALCARSWVREVAVLRAENRHSHGRGCPFEDPQPLRGMAGSICRWDRRTKPSHRCCGTKSRPVRPERLLVSEAVLRWDSTATVDRTTIPPTQTGRRQSPKAELPRLVTYEKGNSSGTEFL